MRVLIVGAGDLGARVAERHRRHGDDVRVARRRPANADDLALDLDDPRITADWPRDVDVLHVVVAPDRRDPAVYRALYVDGIRRLAGALADADRRPRRAIFVSSTAVYGDSPLPLIDEDSATAEPAWNGQLLRLAEDAATALAECTICARVAGIYGPGRTMLIDRVRRQQGEAGGQWTHRIHVDDVAAALVHLAGLPAPRARYNVLDGQPTREFEVLDFIADMLNLPRLPRSADNIQGRRISASRLATTGFRCRYPDFRSGYNELLGRGPSAAGA